MYLSGVFSPFYAYAGYYLHQDYIKENLCINQAKPELDCEGKCYLKTQIVIDVTKTAGNSANSTKENTAQFFTPHFTATSSMVHHFPTVIDLNDFIKYSPFKFNYSTIIFSPPKSLV